MSDRYAVVGHPISHSLSPVIHHLFAEQTSQDLRYDKIEAPLDSFEQVLSKFFESDNGKGLNVTVPFKEQAWRLCGELTERAALAQAVNTVYRNQQGELCGDNTDGCGLVNDLLRQGIVLQSANILIVGAGGAVAGVLAPVLAQSPAKVTLCNRTLSKAESLVARFSNLGVLEAVPMERLSGAYDLVINGTSASLGGQLPQLPECVIGEKTVAYDMMYAQDMTAFNAWAIKLGASKVLDGLGMLVEQAAEAFFIWRGVRPDVFPVLAHLRDTATQ